MVPTFTYISINILYILNIVTNLFIYLFIFIFFIYFFLMCKITTVTAFPLGHYSGGVLAFAILPLYEFHTNTEYVEYLFYFPR